MLLLATFFHSLCLKWNLEREESARKEIANKTRENPRDERVKHCVNKGSLTYISWSMFNEGKQFLASTEREERQELARKYEHTI